MLSLNTPSGFTFSGEQIANLGAAEYTLGVFVNDESGSVWGQERNIEAALRTILGDCKKNPRRDNMLVRVTAFDDVVREVHGFKLLNNIADTDYDNAIQPDGSTALVDATLDALEAVEAYAQKLADQEFLTNALIVVSTDGGQNAGKYRDAARIKQRVEEIRKKEILESVKLILVGFNDAVYFNQFGAAAGFDEIIDAGNLSPGNIAKVANFTSRSFSSTSQALGTGGPSQSLTF